DVALPLGVGARLASAAPAAGEHRTGERAAGHRPAGARPGVAEPAVRPGWRRAPGWAWGLAAAAVLALAALPVLRRGAADAGVSRFETGAGQVRTVRLGDGSVVRLAPNTTLRAAPASRREAWLEGTAFFAIAKRNGVPFVVHTAGGDARVLGTRFELRTAVKTVRLAVLEGRVALSAPGGREVVEAGQVSEIEAGRAPTAPRAADVQTMVGGWMRGVLIFEATPLRQAAREIERQYDVRVRLADPSLGDRTVSAVFDHQSLETVVATICRVTDATCQVEEGTVWVRP
ncbi:MAG: FecR domain-containing protein, partial [Gemmatimonadetes bacterium]|nr:FecR domain-containing protein [Gemmatimonadota bacterium]